MKKAKHNVATMNAFEDLSFKVDALTDIVNTTREEMKGAARYAEGLTKHSRKLEVMRAKIMGGRLWHNHSLRHSKSLVELFDKQLEWGRSGYRGRYAQL